jgi:hypothetical protein
MRWVDPWAERIWEEPWEADDSRILVSRSKKPGALGASVTRADRLKARSGPRLGGCFATLPYLDLELSV